LCPTVCDKLGTQQPKGAFVSEKKWKNPTRIEVETYRQWIRDELANGRKPVAQDMVDRFGIKVVAARRYLRQEGVGQNRAEWHTLNDIDHVNFTATCNICGPGVRVYWNSYKEKWHCAIKADQYGRGTHGLKYGEAGIFKQGKACEVCGTTEGLVIDHCHSRNEIRGVLCHRHNLGIGLFHDNVEDMKAAIEYLERFELPEMYVRTRDGRQERSEGGWVRQLKEQND
jgi:hypothetical protein